MFRRLALLAVLAVLTAGRVVGQENIVLTLAIPQWFQDAFNREYLAPFLEAHPGVDVVLVPDSEGAAYPPSPAYTSLDEHLEAVTKYVTSADVLLISSWAISPESTRAGLWLDLAPLATADPALAEANFYPPAWRAFQWDRGMWALPTIVEPQILLYDPQAFDEAGLTYPDANWSIEQYIEAATTFAPRDSRGNLINAGCWCDLNLMLYGMLGHGLADASGLPMLEDSALAAMVEAWAAARDDIYPSGGYSSEGVAIMMGTPWIWGNPRQDNSVTIIPGDLPGGVYGASVQGFAVSGGTAYPELAFELVKFLAETPINGYASFGAFPALRQSEMTMPENYMVTAFDSLPPEQQQILQDAVETGLTATDLRYFDYVNQAVQAIASDGIDATTALQQAQEMALENLEAAAGWTPEQPVMVATAIPTPSFDSGEIVLDFGVSMWMLPNQQDWERLALAFAETDPEVGIVNINFQGNDYQSWQQNNDCFYLEYDNIFPDAVVTDYLALDPLMDADLTFDASDFVPGALEALQSQGQTYAYPFAVSVTALRYLPEQFEEAGIPLPNMNWTVDEFADALNQLMQVEVSTYSAAFTPRMGENTDWLMLIAAYGGMPVDYRTDPPTWNFTDPANVDAIRQVLDLAKSGLADYQELGTFSFTGMQPQGALMAMILNGYDNMGMGGDEIGLVNYPRGSSGAIMTLGNVGGGYISTNADSPEACYRWFSTISEHPELLSHIMPARMSALDDPATAAAQGEAAVAFYREYTNLASDPNTLHFPAQFGGSFETYFIHQFLSRAFDAYVLEDADLEQALNDAQIKADDFIACYKAVPEVGEGGTEDQYQDYSNSIEQCVELVDPEMAAERQEMIQR